MFEAAIDNFTRLWFLYISMPFTSGVVGYVTNVIAIQMMFYPLKFIGVMPPYLGWQGIIPRKGGKMASIATDTLVPELITEREVFAKLDPERVAAEIEGPLIKLVNDLMNEIMTEYEPALWESLPDAAKQLIVKRVQDDAPNVVADIMEEIKENIEEVFDLKEMVITTLVRDIQLINTVFQEAGREEFKFIGRSGFYFGFLFGIFQMIGWMFYQADWQLPLFGLFVGYATNWIALKMIFRPQQARRIAGIEFHGLFFKRQKEIAYDYARLIADEVVTPSHIIEGVLKGPYADRVFKLIGNAVKRTIDEQAGIAKPFVVWTFGTQKFNQMKHQAVERIVANAPEVISGVDRYAKEAMDLTTMLSSRLEVLPPEKFEGMLRPAFQEDEWMLIAAGAALGFFVGVGQVITFKFVEYWQGNSEAAEAVKDTALYLLQGFGVA